VVDSPGKGLTADMFFGSLVASGSDSTYVAQSPSMLGGFKLCFGQALTRCSAWPQYIHRP